MPDSTDRDGPDEQNTGTDSTPIFLKKLGLLRRRRGSKRPMRPPRLAAPSLRQRLTASLAAVATLIVIVVPFSWFLMIAFLGIVPRVRLVMFLNAFFSLILLLPCFAAVALALRFEREKTTISSWPTAGGAVLGILLAVWMPDFFAFARGRGLWLILPCLGAFAGTYPISRRLHAPAAFGLLGLFIVTAATIGYVEGSWVLEWQF